MAVALVALTVSAQLRASRRPALMQKLFDLDGPSARDPKKTAWDQAGKVRSARTAPREAPSLCARGCARALSLPLSQSLAFSVLLSLSLSYSLSLSLSLCSLLCIRGRGAAVRRGA